MLVTAAAVLFVIVQANTAQVAEKKATAAREKAAAALEAKAEADGAADEARVELERVRVQTSEQLAACKTSAEQAQKRVRIELEEVRAAAAKAVADAQKAAEMAVQQATAERDRILADRAADMREQIEQAKADAQAKVKALQDTVDTAKAKAEPPVKTMSGERTEATSDETPAERDQAMVAEQRAPTGSAANRPRRLSGHRKSKMTPQLVDKAQRMYDSHRYTVAEIAQSCAVSATTIYRHIHTGQTH